jgi:hypothetical protein
MDWIIDFKKRSLEIDWPMNKAFYIKILKGDLECSCEITKVIIE